jgi:hypothetical protein
MTKSGELPSAAAGIRGLAARSVGRIVAAALLVVVIGFGVVRYPLAPWSLGVPLLAYAAMLWWRPVAFLLVLPCVLPAWDLGVWTGWMMVGESDFFVMTTFAVLLIRCRPMVSDMVPRGLAGWVLLAFVVSWSIATIAGLASPLGAAPSDNAFLRPDNALRLAKGFVEALALLPFLRQRERTHGDAVAWLGWGMALGVVAVTVIVLAERALFTSIFDFSGDYRVSGPFSSMRVGGGHIGAYYGLALPMTLCLVRLRPRWLGMGLLLLTCLLGGYGLAVTFARTAYAAGAIGAGVAGLGWLCASRWRGTRAAVGMVPILLVLAILGVAAADTGMRQRFLDSARDLTTRQDNWRDGLAVRDTGVLPTLFGMGLGTYQRAMEMRSTVNRPGDIAIRRDGDGPYVSMRVEAPLYFGEKISVPASGDLHLRLLARSPDEGTALNAALCDKVLLYSDQCRGSGITLSSQNVWQEVTVALPVDGLGRRLDLPGLGWLRRPVELSLFGGPAGHQVELRTVRLTDDAGREVVANGDFSHGLDRWTFTDDDHLSWRMKDVYLMLWFQTGVFGIGAFLALSGLAIAGGLRASWLGATTGAAVAGSVASFLVSGLFDDVVEPTRLATLFFLVCLCGLMQREGGRRGLDPV